MHNCFLITEFYVCFQYIGFVFVQLALVDCEHLWVVRLLRVSLSLSIVSCPTISQMGEAFCLCWGGGGFLCLW